MSPAGVPPDETRSVADDAADAGALLPSDLLLLPKLKASLTVERDRLRPLEAPSSSLTAEESCDTLLLFMDGLSAPAAPLLALRELKLLKKPAVFLVGVVGGSEGGTSRDGFGSSPNERDEGRSPADGLLSKAVGSSERNDIRVPVGGVTADVFCEVDGDDAGDVAPDR